MFETQNVLVRIMIRLHRIGRWLVDPFAMISHLFTVLYATLRKDDSHTLELLLLLLDGGKSVNCPRFWVF